MYVLTPKARIGKLCLWAKSTPLLFLYNLQAKNFFFFWPHCVARGILVPRPGIEPARTAAVKALNPNHWTTREFPAAKRDLWLFTRVTVHWGKGNNQIFQGLLDASSELIQNTTVVHWSE